MENVKSFFRSLKRPVQFMVLGVALMSAVILLTGLFGG